MKLTITFTVMMAIALAAHGQVDFANWELDVPFTWTDVEAFTGQEAGSAYIRAIAGDEQGRLYFYTTDNEFDPLAQLVRADLSGDEVEFTTIATEAEILPALDTNFFPPNVSTMVVNSAGQVHMMEFMRIPDFQEDILRITPGSPATVESLHRREGVSGMLFSEDEQSILITPGVDSGTRDMVTIPADGGEETVFASEAAIIQATGSERACPRCNALRTDDGHIIVWDESQEGGSDSLLSISPSGEVEVLIPNEEFAAGEDSWIAATAIDDFNNIYLGYAFRGSFPSGSLIVLEDGGRGARHDIDRSEIVDRLHEWGHSPRLRPPSFGTSLVVTTTEDNVILHLNSAGSREMVEIRFPLISED